MSDDFLHIRLLFCYRYALTLETYNYAHMNNQWFVILLLRKKARLYQLSVQKYWQKIFTMVSCCKYILFSYC